MIQLKEPELTMKRQVDKIRKEYGHKAASHAFASLYIWKKEMGLQIHMDEQAFTVKFGLRGEHAWFFPCGETKAVKRLVKEVLAEDEEAVFYYMREQDRDLLEQDFPGQFSIRECENDTEYLYDRRQQQELKGKKFSGQRNHINRIKIDYRLDAKKLDAYVLRDVLEVNRFWERRSKEEAGLKDEQAGHLLLTNSGQLDVTGVLVRVDDEPFAIAAGYPLSEDTFDLALVKQVKCLTGLSVYTRNQLIQLLPQQYRWLNAEEDLGVEGLRTMKRQMRPADYVKMYQGFLNKN